MNFVQKDKVAQLHFLRAIAAGGVVLTHARFVLWSGGTAYIEKFPAHTWDLGDYLLFFADMITSLGEQRTFLFFMLSGFFIKYSVRNGFSLPGYFCKRLLRIYPALLVATLLAGVVLYVAVVYVNPAICTNSLREYNSRLVAGFEGLTLVSLLSTLCCSNRGEYFGLSAQFWSLKHEVIFYLIFPLYNLLSFRHLFILLAIGTVLSAASGSHTVFCQLFFLVGMLFYQGYERGLRLPCSSPAWLYYSAFAGLYLSIYLLSKYNYSYSASLLMVVLTFLALEFLLARSIRVPRAVAWFSQVSYSVYLNHMWALLLYYAVLSRVSGELVFYSRWPYYTGAILAVIGSLPGYYFVEKPALAYLQRVVIRKRVIPQVFARVYAAAQLLKRHHTGRTTRAALAQSRPPSAAPAASPFYQEAFSSAKAMT